MYILVACRNYPLFLPFSPLKCILHIFKDFFYHRKLNVELVCLVCRFQCMTWYHVVWLVSFFYYYFRSASAVSVSFHICMTVLCILEVFVRSSSQLTRTWMCLTLWYLAWVWKLCTLSLSAFMWHHWNQHSDL